ALCTNYFLPRKRMRAVKARRSKLLNRRYCGEPSVLLTVNGFWLFVMLSNPPRRAQENPIAWKRFSMCGLSVKYLGKRSAPGGRTSCCCPLIMANGNPVRASTEYAKSKPLNSGNRPQEMNRLGASQPYGPGTCGLLSRLSSE